LRAQRVPSLRESYLVVFRRVRPGIGRATSRAKRCERCRNECAGLDAGFLELVRYGIRKPGDSLIEDSLRVIDTVLKVDTAFGPCWRRYNHDGYGPGADGSPYTGSGQGRAWPLLTGERAHYKFAAGRSVHKFIGAMERFAASGMLPEQVWDEPGKCLGKPAGSAMPLMWAHAEYIKLLRSVRDRQVFDLIPVLADRETAGPALQVASPFSGKDFGRATRCSSALGQAILSPSYFHQFLHDAIHVTKAAFAGGIFHFASTKAVLHLCLDPLRNLSLT
jgi:hypothetical protein